MQNFKALLVTLLFPLNVIIPNGNEIQ